MFSYDESNPDIIVACDLEGVNLAEVDPHVLFREGSTWADRRLLYETIKAYAVVSGWKPTLESRTCIKCSCFARTKRKNSSTREYTNGPLSKDCKWQIRIKSTKNINHKILSGNSEGKYNSVPLVDDGIPVIVSTSHCQHTGNCKPSTQQQIVQRARSCYYYRIIL